MSDQCKSYEILVAGWSVADPGLVCGENLALSGSPWHCPKPAAIMLKVSCGEILGRFCVDCGIRNGFLGRVGPDPAIVRMTVNLGRGDVPIGRGESAASASHPEPVPVIHAATDHPAPWRWDPSRDSLRDVSVADWLRDGDGKIILAPNTMEEIAIASPIVRELIRLAPEMEALLRDQYVGMSCPHADMATKGCLEVGDRNPCWEHKRIALVVALDAARKTGA